MPDKVSSLVPKYKKKNVLVNQPTVHNGLVSRGEFLAMTVEGAVAVAVAVGCIGFCAIIRTH